MAYWTSEQLASIAVVGATERMQYGGRFLRAAMQSAERGARTPQLFANF